MKPNNESVIAAIGTLIWMARRYADRRRTYAAGAFNDAYDILRDRFGDKLYDEEPDTVLTGKGKFYPYAQDGDYLNGLDCVTGRKYCNNHLKRSSKKYDKSIL